MALNPNVAVTTSSATGCGDIERKFSSGGMCFRENVTHLVGIDRVNQGDVGSGADRKVHQGKAKASDEPISVLLNANCRVCGRWLAKPPPSCIRSRSGRLTSIEDQGKWRSNHRYDQGRQSMFRLSNTVASPRGSVRQPIAELPASRDAKEGANNPTEEEEPLRGTS